VVAVPNRDRQAERREATRQEILEAAWDVAREQGLATLTLREVATRVGMRAPSLYSHFPAKHAIYDAMFGQAWEEFERVATALLDRLPDDPRATLQICATTYFDFATADLPRHQLMNQRTVPGFEPSQESYAPAVRVLDLMRSILTRVGVQDSAAIDLWTAVLAGMIEQQWANDPGGNRWRRLLDRAVDMFADEMGLPGPRGDAR